MVAIDKRGDSAMTSAPREMGDAAMMPSPEPGVESILIKERAMVYCTAWRTGDQNWSSFRQPTVG